MLEVSKRALLSILVNQTKALFFLIIPFSKVVRSILGLNSKLEAYPNSDIQTVYPVLQARQT